ncbi:hypothetical protein GB937_002929 [Aspergillus fischeri]|nr:hypothetical protein GB937_002929 [Aspergillus fischeri]
MLSKSCQSVFTDSTVQSTTDAESRLEVYECVLAEIVHDAKLDGQARLPRPTAKLHTDDGVSPVQAAA